MSKILKQIRYLLIRLTHIQIHESQLPKQLNAYFSFGFLDDETTHYSSCISNPKLQLNDTVIMELKNGTLPQSIQLHRWKNHMIMHTLDINISQLSTRTALIKKLETKAHEILTINIRSLSESQLILQSSYNKNTCQHYLIVQEMQLRNYSIKDDKGSSYIIIKCLDKQYCAPTVNSKITLPAPGNIQFLQYMNNQLLAQSKIYRPQQLNNSAFSVQLFNCNKKEANQNQTILKLKLKWGIDLQQVKPQNYLLLKSEDVLLYDFQIKFDNPNQFVNAKAKLIYGNKVFEIINDFNNSKTTKIKKIIQLITKVDNQIAFIEIEKNSKVIAYSKINIQQILYLSVQNLKQKLMNLNEKPIGSLKLKGEKAKSLNSPQHNKIWRESIKNKNIGIGNMQIIIEQISLEYQKFDQLQLAIKASGIDDIILNVPNIQHFNKNKYVNAAPVILNLKQDQNIYIMIRQVPVTAQISEDNMNFIGMALLNPSQIRLGSSCTSLQFYKNQQPTAKLNCIINKILPYSFIKSTFYPEGPRVYIPHRFITISLILNRVLFTSYFYSYNYDHKNQVYCIVQINKQKKVLILQWDKTNSLLCSTSNSSDNLDFDVESNDIIKVKLTLLVSDSGQEEQIYGTAHIKINLLQLNKANNGIKYKQIQIKNNFEQAVGTLDIEAHKGSLYNSHVKESRDVLQTAKDSLLQLKRNKPNLSKVSQSMQIKSSKNNNKQQKQFMKQIRLNTQTQNIEKVPNKQYRVKSSDKYKVSQQRKRKNNSISAVPEMKESPLKLPPIREQQSSPINRKSYDSITKLITIRKNQSKGIKQEKLLLQSYKLINYQERMMKSRQKSNVSSGIINLQQKIEKQNPNLPRNLQILFPKKSPKIQKKNISKKSIQEEQQNLKSFKSVIKQINKDIGQIQPSVNDNKSLKHSSQGSFQNANKNIEKKV